jgi:hypothetical protein
MTAHTRIGAIVLSLVATLAMAATSHALGKTEAKCRASLAKAFTKAVTTADKVSVKCHKARNKDGTLAGIDCNDLIATCSGGDNDGSICTTAADCPSGTCVAGDADSKGKFAKAQAKLLSTAAKKCELKGANNDVLDLFVSCPAPCDTKPNLDNPVTSYSQVADCLSCLAAEVVGNKNATILGSPMSPLPDKSEQKCHALIAKGYSKYLATLLKERTKCQKDDDKADGGTTIGAACLGADPTGKGKVGKALAKAERLLNAACADVGDLSALDSCDTTLPGLETCLQTETLAADAILFPAHYELASTVCPVSITSRVRAGYAPDDTVHPTHLDAGWNGLGHQQDLPDGYRTSLGLTNCDSATPPCGTCDISGVADDGISYAGLTRCAGGTAGVDDSTIDCDEPFTFDSQCGGALCAYYLGPPQPLSASNTPVCVLNYLATDVTGTFNVESGEMEQFTTVRSRVHFGGNTLTQPCPNCVGDVTPQDGVKDGICNGGPNNGGQCDVQASDATFGDVSLDCPPSSGTNVTGSGIELTLGLTTDVASLPFGTKCDFPLQALDCACAVCSDDAGLACNSNTDCSDVGAGTCTSAGGGVPRRPNACTDLTCTDVGNEEGECQAGSGDDVVHACDGELRANGEGYILCDTNADCASVDAVCGDGSPGSCGDCLLSKNRSCFLNPVVADGSPGTDTQVLATAFCVPPTNSSAVNSGSGLPGPSRVVIDVELEPNY